jgi:hypothetical protein
VVTSLGCECVPEDVVLGKHTMIGAKVALVPGIVERCNSLSDIVLSVLIASLLKSFPAKANMVGNSMIFNSNR